MSITTTKELARNYSLSQNWAHIISDKRSYIMGIAIIMIVIYHGRFPQTFGSLHNIIGGFFWLGVEIFLFISGFGMHFALSKDTQQSILSFYHKRLWRLMPTCIIFGIVLLPFWVKGMHSLYNFRTLTFYLAFIGLNTWYIRTQLILYIGSPFLHSYMSEQKRAFALLLICSFVCFALTAPGSPINIKPFFHDFVLKTGICWTINRLPAFLMGLYVAMHWKGEWSKQKSCILTLSSLCFIIVYITARIIVARAPECLTTDSLRLCVNLCSSNDILFFSWPCICVLIAFTSYYLPFNIRRAIEWLGNHSLEIYLTHEPIFLYCKAIKHFNIIYFIITSFAAIILAVVLKHIVRYLLDRLIMKQ